MLLQSSLNSWLARIVDFITGYASFLLAYITWRILTKYSFLISNEAFNVTPELHSIAILLSILIVVFLKQQGAYSYQRFTSMVTELTLVLKSVSLTFLASITIIYFAGTGHVPRTIFVLFWLIAIFLFSIQKLFLYIVARRVRSKGKNRKKVLVVGTGTRAKQFIDVVQRHFDWGLDIIGLLTGNPENVGKEFYGIPVVGSFDEIETILRTINPEEVIITISTKRFDQVRTVLETCEREGVQVRLNSDFFGHITKNVRIDNVHGLNIISFSTVHRSELALLAKRLIDIIGASIALVIFAPFMIVAAVGIWVSDGRPIFYKWNVMGLNKRPFISWKFRTMVRNADELKVHLLKENEMTGPVFKIKNDPRVFLFGRWLRKWSIDETPQLFSVLKGDMSLVGPRPAAYEELMKYESWQRRRLSIKPGLTCLWQVNGRNEIYNFEDWVKLDLDYIDNWSMWLDIKILLKTIPIVIIGRGAS